MFVWFRPLSPSLNATRDLFIKIIGFIFQNENSPYGERMSCSLGYQHCKGHLADAGPYGPYGPDTISPIFIKLCIFLNSTHYFSALDYCVFGKRLIFHHVPQI